MATHTRPNDYSGQASRPGRRSDSSSRGSGTGAFAESPLKKMKSNIRAPPTSNGRLKNFDTSDVEDEGNNDEDEDEDDESEEETDAIAPPGASKKRTHQTGLSISLSNTFLGKRIRSPSIDEDLERPASKMSRTSGAADSADEDDDNYDAVDDISASEDGDFEKHEEKMIIESEDESTSELRRGSQSSADSLYGLPTVDDEASHGGPHHFFNELFPEAHTTLLRGQEADDAESTPTVRRVRFAEDVQLHSSSSTSTASDDDDDDEDDVIYPDLFLQQDSLDPTFRKLIEQKDHDDRSSDGDSYWDFENEQGLTEELDQDGSGSDTGSSGYETDEGETTDEEILPPRTVSKPSTSLRQSPRSATRSRLAQLSNSASLRRGAVASLRRGPLMGSFLIDEDKPIAVVDGHGKHMLFYPAPKHRRQAISGTVAMSSPGPSAMAANQAASETESDVGYSHTDPMLSSPVNVMMSGFVGGRNRSGSALSSEITGPPEAFFPFTSINSNGLVETDDFEDDTYEEYSDDEENLRIEDFINFGEDASSSEDEAQNQSELTDSNNTANEDNDDPQLTPQSSRKKFPGIKNRPPSTPTPAPSGSLLEHFDKGVVSSFRRNNDRHKTWTRSPANMGIKGSRLHIADAPISPLRRRRGGSMIPRVGRSPLRPPGYDNNHQVNNSVARPPTTPQYQFGGPLKKRIQNSNHAKHRKQAL